MTMQEKRAQIGSVYIELQKEEGEIAQLDKKLETLKNQVRAVADDWDRLTVMNNTQLVVGFDFRPLPPESEIAETLKEREQRIANKDRLQAELAQLSRSG